MSKTDLNLTELQIELNPKRLKSILSARNKIRVNQIQTKPPFKLSKIGLLEPMQNSTWMQLFICVYSIK